MKHLALLLAASLPVFAQQPSPPPKGDGDVGPAAATTEAPEVFNARMAWWREAKFGMFLHWGAYSRAAGEWKGTTNHAEWLQFTAKIPLAEFEPFARGFNPVDFNARDWARMAKDAGMKYMVLTTKHHDGFAMFDSPSNPYNIVKATPFKRDPVRELADACRAEGLKFCTYYSLGRDWHDPDVPTGRGDKKGWRSNLIDFPDEGKKDFAKYFERKVKPQVRELLTQYGPIGVMWFDTPELITKAQSEELLKMIRSIQPDCIVNVRIGNGLGDFGTPEQEIPSAISAKPWETCMTMNGKWGWNKFDKNWKSTETLLRNLVDIVSKGGNYLLNVGPTGEGTFPPESVERLAAIGKWMKVNGEAIHGCGPTPFGAELGAFHPTEKDAKGHPKFLPAWDWRCTTKPGRLYITVFTWPGAPLVLDGVKGRVTKASLLADPARAALLIQQDGGRVAITLPAAAPDPMASVVCVEFLGAQDSSRRTE